MNEFVIHACEQVLRFTSVSDWGDLSEERKVQLAFNVGVASLGLNLTKAAGYDALARVQRDEAPIHELHQHFEQLIATHQVPVKEAQIQKPM